MFDITDSETKVLYGDLKAFNSVVPSKIFDSSVISLLSDFSSNIMNSQRAKAFPDLISFAFWCRKSNIEKFQRGYQEKDFRIGLGKVLHIAPRNVPMNFAFSWALAALAGNKSYVKLPSNNFDQIDLFLETLSELSSSSHLYEIANSAIFFRTSHSSDLLRQLTLGSEARIIWGNSQTVQSLRSLETNPRHLDLIFPSRYSISILSADEFAGLGVDESLNVVRNFVKDALTFGQRGCSSPRLLFWLGSDSSYVSARNKFWNLTSRFTEEYLDPADNFARFANLATSTIRGTGVNDNSISIHESLIHFENSQISKSSIEQVMTLGTFQEVRVNALAEVLHQLDRNVQTVTYFGVSPDELLEAITLAGFTGIDRIVPFGAAFDMNPVWDGVDVIRSLSRVIEVRRRP